MLQLRSSNKEVASCTSSTASLKRIISHSFNILTSKGPSDSADILQRESSAVAQAVVYHFSCQLMCEEAEEFEEFEGHISVDLDPVNWKKLKEIVSVYFPESDITIDKGKLPDSSTELTEAIKTQLKEHHLQPLPPFEEKVYFIAANSFIPHQYCTYRSIHYTLHRSVSFTEVCNTASALL